MTNLKVCECGCGEVLPNQSVRFIKGHHNRSALIKQKKQNTNLQKYGVINPSQRTDVKEKKKDTFREHYGVDHFMQCEKGRENITATLLEKYGVDNVFRDKTVIEKIKNTRKQTMDQTVKKRVRTSRERFYDNLLDRLEHKFEPCFTKEEFSGVGKSKYLFKCTICGNTTHSNLDDGSLPRCYTCTPLITTGGQSVIENSLISHLKILYTGNTEVQTRAVIPPFELDIYIADKQIAIELDGLYWHSAIAGNKYKTYHLHKTEECIKHGIKLIHIFEDEWKQKPRIIKSKLKHIFGLTRYKINARECKIQLVDNITANRFLNKYHIQGSDRSTIHLSMTYRNRIVAVMTFCPLRTALGHTQKEGEWELSRYATINNFNVVGGAAKLLKHFEREYTPKSVLSYADRRWSEGKVYHALGFQLDHISPPNYWYLDRTYQKRHYRYNYRKSLLQSKLEKFDPELSEWENMKNNGWDRIWDCGNLVFKKVFD